ncbi:hypothetical protein SAMN05216582_10811 [Selenomonas ruminantium]|uniref:Uncharacterized protein n=1 Tax=Selenomonas ruminantium TaxID=971 RepID=A0A1M6TJL0_SELRU|nr:hypothetical protein [Selenomonas ruminantium]SHK57093.1 hypothetical protein SAMN05216582_10811 [Selenomonas ruminantium]
MSINTIAATSSLNYWHQQAQAARTSHSVHGATSAFGKILASLTAAEKAADSEVEKGVSTVTLTRVLADGSLVLQRVEGNKVISETKLDGSSVLQQQHLLEGNGLSTAYAGTAAMGSVGAGSVYRASV